MILKISKIIICVIVAMSLFCSSMTVFAEPEVDFDFNIQPVEPTTQKVADTTESETKKNDKTDKDDEADKEVEKDTTKSETKAPSSTKAETTKKPTKKPDKTNETTKKNSGDNKETTKVQNKPTENTNKQEPEKTTVPSTTRPAPTKPYTPPQNNNNNVQANANNNAQTTEEAFEDESLPEGAFYVYLERNNGQRRLTTLMEKPGLVPEPSEPTRAGYVFDGWYADSKFETLWNFFTDEANEPITIYAKWVADPNTIVYDIIVEDCVGGKIEVSPQKASLGEPVVINVIPDEGKRLVQGSICINGEPTDFLSFVMPKGKVVISASFEDVPEKPLQVEEENNLPKYIILGVLGAIILVAIIIVLKKRHDFNADLDPEEELYVPEDDGDNWIDETIVVEDGFVEGKKVVENTEPDYGAPDLDEDDLD